MLNSLILLLAPQGAGGGSDFVTLLFIGGMFVVMYFFIIRPQTKKQNEQKKFIENIKKGDKVVSIAGLHGKVLRVGTETLLVQIDSNTKVRLEKSAVSMEYSLKARESKEKDKEDTESAPTT